MDLQYKKIEQLHPLLRHPVLEFRTKAAAAGHPLLLVWTFRDAVEQLRIYQEGRTYNRETGEWDVTDKAKVKTNAKPGQSSHNVLYLDGSPAALGLDVIPVDAQGRPLWETPDNVWTVLYALAGDCGLDPYGDVWGAYLKSDKGHFEEPGWKLKLDALGCRLPKVTSEGVKL